MNKTIFLKEQRGVRYYVVAFEYDAEIVSSIRKVPTSKFRAKEGLWYIRVCEEASYKLQLFITKHQFDCSDGVIAELSNRQNTRSILSQLSRAEDSTINIPIDKFPKKPYRFQLAGVEYLLRAKRCFQGDDMGLGKTAQTLMALETGGLFPAIVICPNVAKENWRREIDMWLPHRTSMILGDQEFDSSKDIYIVNYEGVQKHLSKSYSHNGKKTYDAQNHIKELGAKALICDESHYLKSPKSQRTRAVKAISKYMEYIWLLSGTIIDNRPKEFIPQLQILRRLEDFGGYLYFINRYCDAKRGYGGHMVIDGESNLKELNEKLRRICMIRRRKIDILDELPGKQSRIISVDIDNRNEYKYARTDIIEWLKDEKRRKENKNGVLDLFPDSQSEESLELTTAIELQVINALKVITSRGKTESVLNWIKKFKKTRKKLVVFAYHKEMQNRIIKEFPDCQKILGGMTSKEKQQQQDIFDEKGWLIVCSLKAANTAINLVSAHNMLCCELGWTPSIHDQMEDRIWRIGQKEECTIYYILSKETIDEDIYELIQEKRQIVEESLDGHSTGYKVDIKKELIKRLGLEYELSRTD